MRGPKPFLDKALGKFGIRYDSRRKSQTALAINEDGMYSDQLATLYQRAIDRVTTNNNQLSFSAILEDERKKMRKEMEELHNASLSR